MQTFSFIITDPVGFETEPVRVELESDKEAVMYGSLMAREMLEQMPSVTGEGMRVTVYDDDGEPLAIVPVDPVH